MPYTDRHWTELFKEVGARAMLEDPRFTDIASRTQNIDLLYDELAKIMTRRTTTDWEEIFDRLDIPAAPVLGLEELLNDDHLVTSGFFADVQDEGMGSLRFPGVPVCFDGVRPDVAMPPRLGEHTIEVLASAGLEPSEVDELISSGAAYQCQSHPEAQSKPDQEKVRGADV